MDLISSGLHVNLHNERTLFIMGGQIIFNFPNTSIFMLFFYY